MESTHSLNPRLRVELYDWDAVSSHDFLGGIELDVEELVELQRITLGKARANSGNMDEQVQKSLQEFLVHRLSCCFRDTSFFRN